MTVLYAGEMTTGIYSPAVWQNLPPIEKLRGTGQATIWELDPLILPETAVDSVIDEDDSGASVAVDTSAAGGGIKLTTGSTNNNEVWFTGLGPVCDIDSGNGKMAFEVLFKQSTVSDNALSVVMGLSSVIAAGTGVVQKDATGALETSNGFSFVGFHTLQASADTLQAVYRTTTASPTAVDSSAQTLVAATTYAAGITFDGNSTIEMFIGDTSLGTVEYDASGFPNGIVLVPLFAAKNGTGAGGVLTILGARSVQLK